MKLTWSQREDDLRGGVHPELGVSQEAPVRSQIVTEPLTGPGECQSSPSQDDQDEVGEEGGEVGHLAAGLDPLDEAEGHNTPGRGQAGHALRSEVAKVVPVVSSVAQHVPLVVLRRCAAHLTRAVGVPAGGDDRVRAGLLTPAGGGVVPVVALAPLQLVSQAGRQVPDGPADQHVVVEGEEQSHTDHSQS